MVYFKSLPSASDPSRTTVAELFESAVLYFVPAYTSTATGTAACTDMLFSSPLNINNTIAVLRSNRCGRFTERPVGVNDAHREKILLTDRAKLQ